MNEQESLTATLDRDLAAMAGLARRITEQIDAGQSDAGQAMADSAQQPQAHGPRVVIAPDAGMVRSTSPRTQQEHLDDLVRRYTARTAASRQLAQRHRRRLADSRAVVGFRKSTKEMLYPVAARRADGARIEDIDGNSYTDITMGFGVLLFGHEPGFVREAVREHLSRGIRLGPRSVETGGAAELLCELTGLERVAFANSGTEANAGAIRLARAATGRDRIVTFQGSYHGHADQVLGRPAGRGAQEGTVPVSRGIPHSAVGELTVLEYGSEEALQAIERDAARIAVVIVEPVQSRHPSLQPAAFVRRLRELTARHGIVLMFDEMLTGFRPALRGAQDLYGVTPDLATYGKLLGGGFPIGAVAGRSDIMDGIDGGHWTYGDDSGPTADTTFFGGTYLQHPVSMTAAHAVLTHLKEHSPHLQERLNARTTELATGLNDFFEAEEFPLRMGWFGSQFRFEHRADMELLYYHLMLRGVHVWEWRNFFLSTAHTDGDIEHVADAVRGSLRDLRKAGFFRTGKAPSRRPAPGRADVTPAGVTPAAALPVPMAEAVVEAVTDAPPVPVAAPVSAAPATPRRADFSLYFFGDYPDDGPGPKEGRYELLMEAARFADHHGFEALWMPERHFNSFGGLFPNPAVLAAALSRETRRIRLNAGSVVLPLHDPIRVAEEWSMADNLSGGRVGLGVASGWNANDFVFFPERFGPHKQEMYDQLEQVRSLWRGETLRRTTGDGEREIRLFPRPVQTMPPLYTAVVANPESYEQAAAHDLGIVTNLMTQDIDQLRDNIARYRRARARHGLDPDAGRVAVLLHTYLSEDHDTARAEAFAPMARYMQASLSLFSGVTNSLGVTTDLRSLSEDDLDVVFRRAYGRYCDQRALIGSVDTVLPVAEAVVDAGADEIVALVDFGVCADQLRAGLPRLDALRRRHRERRAPDPGAPLSPGQERIWFLERLLPGRTAYNEVKAIRLRGALDTEALHTALRRLVARHEGLRTVFRQAGDSAVQLVREAAEPDFAVVDGTLRAEAAVREALATESARRFDLENGPLFVSRVVRTAADEHVLVLSFHHIVVDAASATVLCRDLSAFYRAERDGTEAGLPALTWSYAEHAREQRAAADSPDTARDLAHWRRVLGGDLPVLELPTDRPRPAEMTSEGRAVFRSLDPGLSEQVRQLSRGHRATLFMTLVAGWAAMLQRVTGQEDIVIGVPVSDRPQRAEELIGFFVNTLALRVDLTGDPGFATLLDRVRTVALDAYDHAGTPFEKVVRVLAPPRRTDRTPVFQVCAEFQSAEPFRLDLPGIEAVALDAGPDKALTDLTVYFTDGPEGVRCHLEYNADLFEPSTVDMFFTVFRDLLAAAVGKPGTPLSLLARTAVEGDEVPESWEHGPVRPVADTTVHGWVARQAAEHPTRTAVVGEDAVLTYRELDERAGRLAAVLAEHRADDDQESLVAVWLPRSAELVVALLAVLRAGCAYVPLDPSLGAVRATQVIAESGARTVISGADGPGDLRLPGSVTVVAPDAAPAGDPGAGTGGSSPSSACSVIYTSGSTGTPKGVVLTHRGLVDLCQWHHERFAFTGDDRSAVVCSQSFDASLLEIWPALTAGGTIVVAGEPVRRDPLALARWYADQDISFSILPTALGEQVLRLPAADQPPLRHLLLGGEALRSRPRPEAPYETLNIYGPTETTVLCVVGTVPPRADGPVPDEGADVIAIGRPADNVTVRVVDASDKPVPIGAVGELFVGGPGVAAGYLHRPDLTEERFAAGPEGGTETRCYRTGDLVRWTADGRLVFVGRTDDQVKIRGFRVEPEEVAQVLGRLDGVSRAAVVGLRRANGEAFLSAYVVPTEPGWDSTAEQRSRTDRWAEELNLHLPEYMVPRVWRVLTELPLTGNGKVDRTKLPAADPFLPADGEGARRADGPPPEAEPLTALENGLRDLWAAEFGLTASGIDPDVSLFDLGGHSLTAMRLVNRIREAWGIEYPLSRLYQEPTLRAMTEFVHGAGSRRVVRTGPASHQQARFASVHSRHAKPQVFNVALRITFSGRLDPASLRTALQQLTERHEALRTRLVREGLSSWRQEVLEPRPVDLPVDDLTSRPEPERQAQVRRLAEQATETPLDLFEGDVLSTRLLRTGAEEWVLLLVMHHCTCDGWALTTLLKELAALYRTAATGTGHGLSSAAPQQVEYAHWQVAHEAATRERRTDYWLEELADAPFTVDLPLDRPRPDTLSGRGGVIEFTVPAEVRADVERLAVRRATTPFVVTAAALGRLLAAKAEQEDVVMSVSYAGRESREFESLVGCTAIALALRVRDARAGSFAALMERVTRTTVLGMEHAMPPRRVAPAMRERRGVDMPDGLAIGLAYESSLDTGIELPGITATVAEIAPAASRSEFIMVLTPAGDVLEGAVEYSADLWDRATVETWTREYVRLLRDEVREALADGAHLQPDSPR
ncbi:MupA/Atu3671 family FMN-dependent luciferase-like monooxygenase [Streptomyces sp. NBC_01285]|uniref:MupA/Atu3671 family FMN-dependent luciferase-like monooxygenase n=1 Tax=Streptomyces sp. NBC_01285 TaxID=2903813 RepID=UPI00224FED3B|nr:MupA/Atu3671 family FMN-dependent luciferase-like monooxygenase [Streptomyces sp. NBC_01285]MCX4770330.1 amino acid adenylation domain-containing protein [Streptomyces sp. NBC_01285]